METNTLIYATMRTKRFLSSLMSQAWQLVKVYGMTMAEAMKKAWMIAKLNIKMKNGIVKFYYEKLNGEIRTAWGTLKESLIPEASGTTDRKKNDTVIVYYDQEKQAFRSFKKANIAKIA
jgi:hypothetical protein